MESVLAIDIGGSKIIAVIFMNDRIISKVTVPTPANDIEISIRNAASRVLLMAGISKVEIAGVSAPGPLDLVKGAIVNPPNLEQEYIDLITPLEGLAESVIIANDAVSGAWAERVLAKVKFSDFVLVTIGTGVGGGVVVGNRLLLGRRGGAHEIGHIVIDINGPECGCGGRGHWEALAGGRWFKRLLNDIFSDCKDVLEAPDIFEEARRGSECALRVVDFLARVNGAGLASISAVYDPEAIFLSGGFYWAGRDLLLPLIRKYAFDYLMNDRKPVILNASFGPLQSLYGAYAIAISPPRDLVELNRHRLSPG